jgi:hypothetical protein
MIKMHWHISKTIFIHLNCTKQTTTILSAIKAQTRSHIHPFSQGWSCRNVPLWFSCIQLPLMLEDNDLWQFKLGHVWEEKTYINELRASGKKCDIIIEFWNYV